MLNNECSPFVRLNESAFERCLSILRIEKGNNGLKINKGTSPRDFLVLKLDLKPLQSVQLDPKRQNNTIDTNNTPYIYYTSFNGGIIQSNKSPSSSIGKRSERDERGVGIGVVRGVVLLLQCYCVGRKGRGQHRPGLERVRLAPLLLLLFLYHCNLRLKAGVGGGASPDIAVEGEGVEGGGLDEVLILVVVVVVVVVVGGQAGRRGQGGDSGVGDGELG